MLISETFKNVRSRCIKDECVYVYIFKVIDKTMNAFTRNIII